MAKDDNKKSAADIEAERRANLSEADRLAEDALAAQIAAQQASAEEAANRNPNARQALEAQRRGILPADTAPKDTAVVVARGREVFTEPNQLVGHPAGATLMVSAAEARRLRAAGAVVNDGVVVEAAAGPQVYREAGLLLGHAPGQGQTDK